MAEADLSGSDQSLPTVEHFGANIGRAAAGALIFSLPMLMTMEMWWIGFYVDEVRLATLLAVTVPLLVALSHYVGFEDTFCLTDDLRDAFLALAVGAGTSAIILWIFGIIAPDMSLREIIGKVALQSVPASIGALLARSQMGGEKNGGRQESDVNDGSYPLELFIMAVGALFLSFNLAPTEEMILIAYKMSTEKELLLVVLSMLIMHGFVFAVNFHGESEPPPRSSMLGLFVRFTVVGYAIVFLVSLFMLWVFGRVDEMPLDEILSAGVVLAFPGALGGAAARLIL